MIDGPGHRALHNVLKAYLVYDTEVGYTHGMNFIARMLMLYMNEEETFSVMVSFLKGCKFDVCIWKAFLYSTRHYTSEYSQ
jgi:hypothetical protein